MASIRKRGKKWLAEVRLKSGYKAKTFHSKLEAQAWAVSEEQEMGRNAGLVRGKKLSDAFLRYAEEVSPTKKGQRWELVRLNKLCRADFASILLTDLGIDDINQWKDSELKRIKASSVNRELNLIAAVIETAKKQWKWIEANPARDVDRPKNPSARDRRISESEIARILDSLGYQESGDVNTQRQQIAVAFLFALETGMRQGEIWGLDWCCVDIKNRFVTLPETKNGTKRDVPLSLRAV